MGEITRIVTGVSIIVTADSKENPGIGHVRLESPVTIRWNERSRWGGIRSKARRENSAASRLLGTTSLRFALHGWQRLWPPVLMSPVSFDTFTMDCQLPANRFALLRHTTVLTNTDGGRSKTA
ncbi:hypothetical protein [Thiolapillus sp.]|uniref:hypothetical protein n=1 Tax=Thiolapillus sp. TaxID=2017437 RepID=UPI003AF51016